MVFVTFLLAYLASSSAKSTSDSYVEHPSIGIYLGSSSVVVAYHKHGRLNIVTTEIGRRLTPTVVSQSSSGVLAGETAAPHAALNHQRTLHNFLCLIGRPLNDPYLIASQNFYRTLLHASPSSAGPAAPVFEVELRGATLDDTTDTPGAFAGVERYHTSPRHAATPTTGVQVARMSPFNATVAFLTHLKRSTDDFFGSHTVRETVIAVPSCFGGAQTEALVQAAEQAGWAVVGTLTAVEAVALSNSSWGVGDVPLPPIEDARKAKGGVAGVDMRSQREGSGGPLGGARGRGGVGVVVVVESDNMTVSVVEAGRGSIPVVAVDVDNEMAWERRGALAFDRRCVSHFETVLKDQFGLEVRGEVEALGRLRSACARARVELCEHESVTFEVELDVEVEEGGGKPVGRFLELREPYNRALFEKLTTDLLDVVGDRIEAIVAVAAAKPAEVEFLTIGGDSARIPRLAERLAERLGVATGRVRGGCGTTDAQFAPEEFGAVGAAVRAAVLQSKKGSGGVRTAGGDGAVEPEAGSAPLSQAVGSTEASNVAGAEAAAAAAAAPSHQPNGSPRPLALPIGVEGAGGVMVTLLPAGAVPPASAQALFTPLRDDQQSVAVRVYEGVDVSTRMNRLVGKLRVGEMDASARLAQEGSGVDVGGVAKVAVTGCISDNGDVVVSAVPLSGTELEEKEAVSDPGISGGACVCVGGDVGGGVVARLDGAAALSDGGVVPHAADSGAEDDSCRVDDEAVTLARCIRISAGLLQRSGADPEGEEEKATGLAVEGGSTVDEADGVAAKVALEEYVEVLRRSLEKVGSGSSDSSHSPSGEVGGGQQSTDGKPRRERLMELMILVLDWMHNKPAERHPNEYEDRLVELEQTATPLGFARPRVRAVAEGLEGGAGRRLVLDEGYERGADLLGEKGCKEAGPDGC